MTWTTYYENGMWYAVVTRNGQVLFTSEMYLEYKQAEKEAREWMRKQH